ncbi:MAG TPA: DUF5915 domain-containing protein, partial [Actinomycetota bacterium]
DVALEREVLQGWGVASDAGVTVALDLELDDDLRREGRARELVRIVQDARKAAGLDVSDRIELGLAADGAAADARDAHLATIAGETLATSVSDGELGRDAFRQASEVDGETVVVTLRRATPGPRA